MIHEYGGWNRADRVFRLTWTTAADGSVAGQLHLVHISPEDVVRRTLAVSGRQTGRHLSLALSETVEGTRAFHGRVTPGRLVLLPSRNDLEDIWLGSPVAISGSMAKHVRILRGPGGYEGWRFRQQRSRAAVHRVDVDGDGRKDLVVVTWADVRHGVREVLVHFANGAVAAVHAPSVLAGVGSYGAGINGWDGTAHIPGTTGRQLVLLDMAGAANVFFSVVMYDRGTLRLLPAPGFDGAWNVGGTVGTGTLGSFCRRGLLYIAFSRGPRLRLNSYVWRQGWVPVNRIRKHVTDGRFGRHLPSGGLRPLLNCG